MSFVDLATVTLHRRSELEARINTFVGKCDHAINDIQKLKSQAENFVHQLNCEPTELRETFLKCMKQLDEYTYLITDFNLALGNLDEKYVSEHTPVHDTTPKPSAASVVHETAVKAPSTVRHASAAPLNLLDVLSEPTPSKSATCANRCPSEKPKRIKVPKEDQLLIAFSSASNSSESVPQSKSEMVAKEVQCEMVEEVNNLTITCPSTLGNESCNLPAQQILQTDHVYQAVIMSMDEDSFWVITDDIDEVQKLMIEMTQFYKTNHIEITLEELSSLTYCAFYDDSSDCFYRALFIKILEDDMMSVEVFLVDTGEVRSAPAGAVRPLAPRFCARPPAARCCHLQGIDLLGFNNKELLEKQEEFMKEYVGRRCHIEVDDNSTSESLGVYVVLPDNESEPEIVLNDLLVQRGLAIPNKPQLERVQIAGPAEMVASELDIMQCPEFEDPVEAVTGYSNRDEADICKHYKGGSEKTCFKGPRCTKKHIMKHPDGWTTDKVEVVAKLKSLPLPAPGTWLKVLVTYICHFDRIFVQLVEKEVVEEKPSFGVILPPTTLSGLVRDMNSPAARMSYKRLTLTPAPGEMVAALYPLDNQWYRARVITVTRADQNVEVMYVDYGNVVWVKEDEVRALEPRLASLPAQALRCALAGVAARSRCSAQWAAAKAALAAMTQDRTLDAHVIARDYDELVVELYDSQGYSVAEQLAARDMIELKEYAVHDDSRLTRRVLPA